MFTSSICSPQARMCGANGMGETVHFILFSPLCVSALLWHQKTWIDAGTAMPVLRITLFSYAVSGFLKLDPHSTSTQQSEGQNHPIALLFWHRLGLRCAGLLLIYHPRLLISQSYRILFCWCRRVRLFIFVAFQCKTLKLESRLLCAYFKRSLVVLLTVTVCPAVLPLNPFFFSVPMQPCTNSQLQEENRAPCQLI